MIVSFRHAYDNRLYACVSLCCMRSLLLDYLIVKNQLSTSQKNGIVAHCIYSALAKM